MNFNPRGMVHGKRQHKALGALEGRVSGVNDTHTGQG